MNEAHDPLEAELSALRPHELSPELRQRIADRRARSGPQATRWRWGLALAGGLAAACLAVAVLLPVGRRPARRTEANVARPGPSPSPRHRSRSRTRGPRSWRTGTPWPARPKTWMPCSPRMLWSPRNLTLNSCESVLSLGPMRHSHPC